MFNLLGACAAFVPSKNVTEVFARLVDVVLRNTQEKFYLQKSLILHTYTTFHRLDLEYMFTLKLYINLNSTEFQHNILSKKLNENILLLLMILNSSVTTLEKLCIQRRLFYFKFFIQDAWFA